MNETVQSEVGSTRGHTCSGWLPECSRNGEVMCGSCEVRITCVFCIWCVCAMELLIYREKGIVLVLPSGMAQFGSIDQSRWSINCGGFNMFFVRPFAATCIVNVSLVLWFAVICIAKNLSPYEESIEY